MIKKIYDVAIIGSGIIGLTIAEEFLRRGIKKVIILEKNLTILSETSSHNSGLIHGGFDATPGKLKARLNVAGRLLYEQKYLIEDAEFPWRKVSSFILAYNQQEIDELNKLYQQGIDNGLNPSDLAIIEAEEVLKNNPFINKEVKKALVCYCSYLIAPHEFGEFIFRKAKALGLEIKTNFSVSAAEKSEKQWILKSQNGEKVVADYVVNAAGVWSEEVARLVTNKPDFNIETRRGQYLILDKTQGVYASDDVFFLTPSKHGKGVIVAKQFDGRVLVGPNAEQGVPKLDIQLVTPEGLRFVRKIGKKINPNLNLDRVETVMAGSRAINIISNDFYIEESKGILNFLHVAGIQSPGLSSAPAIAEYVFQIYKRATV